MKAQRKSYRKRVEKFLRAVSILQMAARRYIFWQRRGAEAVRRRRAAIKIQARWRGWDVWNRMAQRRLEVKGQKIFQLKKLAKTYQHARPETRAQGSTALLLLLRYQHAVKVDIQYIPC